MQAEADKGQKEDECLTNHILRFGRLKGELIIKVKIKNPTTLELNVVTNKI